MGTLSRVCPVNDLDLSNDGTLLAVAFQSSGSRGPRIAVYDVSDGSEVGAFGEEAYAGRGVAFRDRQLHFALEHTDHRVEFCQGSLPLKESQHIAWYHHTDLINALSRDESGATVALNGKRYVEVWDLNKKEVIRHKPNLSLNAPHPARSAISADGHRLFIYGLAGDEVISWDVRFDNELGRWRAPTAPGPASQLLLSQDERFLFVAGGKGVYLYCLKNDSRVAKALYDDASPRQMKTFVPSRNIVVGPGMALDVMTLEATKLPLGPTGIIYAAAQAWRSATVAFATVRGEVFWYTMED